MRISLKAGDKIYINGAVLRVDRKVSLQLLNDATFLLGAHVLQVEDATTPLRQLYFVVQTLLIDPDGEGDALDVFARVCTALREAFTAAEISGELDEIERLVKAGSTYAALKRIRDLYPLEKTVMASDARIPGLLSIKEGEQSDGHLTGRVCDDPPNSPSRQQLVGNG